MFIISQSLTWAHCYITFSVRNLQNFVISWSQPSLMRKDLPGTNTLAYYQKFVNYGQNFWAQAKPFQPSLMFVGGEWST
jgi:hypothetical protein